jgi:hypothetical protein
MKQESKKPVTETKTVKNTVVSPVSPVTNDRKPYVRNEKKYLLFCPGKGFMMKDSDGTQTFGVDGELVTFGDIRQAKFAMNFLVSTVKFAEELMIMNKV